MSEHRPNGCCDYHRHVADGCCHCENPTAEREGLAEIAGVLAEHRLARRHGTTIAGFQTCECSCGLDHRCHLFASLDMCDHYHRAHLADALADLLAARDRRVRGEALREAAEWVAEGVGYPVECTMPDHPMPQALWDALVEHVHADAAGKWHGNTLDREDTASWLADEAGRADA